MKEAVKSLAILVNGQIIQFFFPDHKPLEKINIRARTGEELGDIAYYLSQYDFQITYHSEKNNLEGDCLSRNPVLEAYENEKETFKTVNLIKLDDIFSKIKKKI